MVNTLRRTLVNRRIRLTLGKDRETQTGQGYLPNMTGVLPLWRGQRQLPHQTRGELLIQFYWWFVRGTLLMELGLTFLGIFPREVKDIFAWRGLARWT